MSSSVLLISFLSSSALLVVGDSVESAGDGFDGARAGLGSARGGLDSVGGCLDSLGAGVGLVLTGEA